MPRKHFKARDRKPISTKKDGGKRLTRIPKVSVPRRRSPARNNKSSGSKNTITSRAKRTRQNDDRRNSSNKRRRMQQPSRQDYDSWARSFTTRQLLALLRTHAFELTQYQTPIKQMEVVVAKSKIVREVAAEFSKQRLPLFDEKEVAKCVNNALAADWVYERTPLELLCILKYLKPDSKMKNIPLNKVGEIRLEDLQHEVFGATPKDTLPSKGQLGEVVKIVSGNERGGHSSKRGDPKRPHTFDRRRDGRSQRSDRKMPVMKPPPPRPNVRVKPPSPRPNVRAPPSSRRAPPTSRTRLPPPRSNVVRPNHPHITSSVRPPRSVRPYETSHERRAAPIASPMMISPQKRGRYEQRPSAVQINHHGPQTVQYSTHPPTFPKPPAPSQPILGASNMMHGGTRISHSSSARIGKKHSEFYPTFPHDNGGGVDDDYPPLRKPFFPPPPQPKQAGTLPQRSLYHETAKQPVMGYGTTTYQQPMALYNPKPATSYSQTSRSRGYASNEYYPVQARLD